MTTTCVRVASAVVLAITLAVAAAPESSQQAPNANAVLGRTAIIQLRMPCGSDQIPIGGLAVAADAAGNVFMAEIGKTVVFKLPREGAAGPVAGNGGTGYGGDGGQAISATLDYISAIAADAAGNLFIAEASSPRIRKVTPAGIITTVAGNGAMGFSGDGGPATSASLCLSTSLAVDAAGNLFIASGPGTGVDSLLEGDYRVRKVTPGGVITTVAGMGRHPGRGGPGAPAPPPLTVDGTAAIAGAIWPMQIAAGDAGGNLFFFDGNGRIRKVAPTGVITTVAGNGAMGFSGDGGPATSAQIERAAGLAVDRAGNLFIAARSNRVRKVDQAGVIRTIAGDGTRGFSGDGGPATAAQLNVAGNRGRGTAAIAVDGTGNFFIAERGDVGGSIVNRIRRVNPAGVISTTFSGVASEPR